MLFLNVIYKIKINFLVGIFLIIIMGRVKLKILIEYILKLFNENFDLDFFMVN